MPVVTDRSQSLEIHERFRSRGVIMAVLGTSSHWNTEAVLKAAQSFARKRGIKDIAVSLAMTFTYKHWPQAVRATYSGDPAAGLLSNIEYARVLCGTPSAPYGDVTVLPHLDHAHPERDKWALTEALPYLSSVMFDAQTYSYEENVALTREYVERHGKQVVIEGIVDQLGVDEKGSAQGGHRRHDSADSDQAYADRVKSYMEATGVDFIVGDLGTEQQTQSTGACRYLKERSKTITRTVGKSCLVLHGTSCLTEEQMRQLAGDGIARVNMWTRIARESGQYAAEQLMKRMDQVRQGDLKAADACQYLNDSVAYGSQLMEEVLDILGYGNL
jgi:fructose/tagatose bisphosphate aldolase